MKYVIDSNALIVASGRSDHVQAQDQLIVARFLNNVMRGEDGEFVLIDAEELAISEYKNYFDFSGQPSIADEFFAWLVREQWAERRVVRVASDDGATILDLIPASLESFDSDDHKWICIFLQGRADWIVNAVDSDWAEASVTLKAEKIRVLELLR